MCGEQFRAALFDRNEAGSSPRVRGTVTGSPNGRAANRIIPACAGNSKRTPRVFRIYADHPRVCGEQDYSGISDRTGDGSSPRVRGTGISCNPCGLCERIIPACAGNRSQCMNDLTDMADHPRVCGEQCHAFSNRGPSIGSSPRVRGTALRVRPPSRAGPDHPRVCGEQALVR